MKTFSHVLIYFLSLTFLRVCPRCQRWAMSREYSFERDGRRCRDAFCSRCRIEGVPRLRNTAGYSYRQEAR